MSEGWSPFGFMCGPIERHAECGFAECDCDCHKLYGIKIKGLQPDEWPVDPEHYDERGSEP